MSDRRTSPEEGLMRDWMRDVSDRLNRLESGGATAGYLSLAARIDLGAELGGDVPGGVSIIVEPYPDIYGSGRTVTFQNMLTGSTYVITLP